MAAPALTLRRFAVALALCLAVAAPAQAGLFGALVGAGVGAALHHGAAQAGTAPVMGATAGGAALEGAAAGDALEHHPVLTGLGVAAAAGLADAAAHQHCRTVDDAGVKRYVCDAAPTPAQGWRDLLAQRRSAQILAANLTAAGDPRPGAGCAAHHIVPWNDGRFTANAQMRQILEECNIDINSALNGVWLPQTRHSTCKGKYHPTLHTKSYSDSILEDLVAAQDSDGCDGVKKALKSIKNKLGNL